MIMLRNDKLTLMCNIHFFSRCLSLVKMVCVYIHGRERERERELYFLLLLYVVLFCAVLHLVTAAYTMSVILLVMSFIPVC